MKRQALGRGLSALFGDAPRGETPGVSGLMEVEVDSLVPGSFQPREDFADDKLEELAKSIQANGVIQPIVVRHDGQGGLEIVAGERRWRAAKRLGLKTIPAVVKELARDKALEIALIENIQREDLNPLEEARAFELLMREHGLTQEEVAQRVSKDRTSVANTLRLLRLPEDLQGELKAGRLSMGQARALLGVESADRMRALARRVISEGLSVRQVEGLVRGVVRSNSTASGSTRMSSKTPSPGKDVHDRAAEKKLSTALATKVEIRRARRGGQVAVHFYSEEELIRVYDLLTRD